MSLIDTAVDLIKDVLDSGPTNWRERLAATVELVSPDGDSYSPKWQGDPRSLSKKLGVFEYPKVRGSIVQDLEVSSDTYELTLYFDGENNDLEASRFFTSCRQKGTWQVTHPVHGFVELQLISVKEDNQPTTNGNITEVSTKWIEPLDPTTLKTARELAGLLDTAVEDLNVSAAQQFANAVSQASQELVRGIENTSRAINTLTTRATTPLFTTIDALDNAIVGIQSAINDTITQTTITLDSLAGQTQQLTQLPTLGSGDTQDKMSAYTDLVTSQVSALPTTVTTTNSGLQKNNTATIELSLLSALGSIGKVVSFANISTKAQAIDLAQSVLDTFDLLTNGLDDVQEKYEGFAIDLQYFSQSEAYANALNLVSLCLQYLLALAPDLKVERRFVLERPRAPIEIAVTEYGGPGEDDANIDLFIESNGLKDIQIFMLPAGTEVVVYA